jgi:hypothetical protein
MHPILKSAILAAHEEIDGEIEKSARFRGVKMSAAQRRRLATSPWPLQLGPRITIGDHRMKPLKPGQSMPTKPFHSRRIAVRYRNNEVGAFHFPGGSSRTGASNVEQFQPAERGGKQWGDKGPANLGVTRQKLLRAGVAGPTATGLKREKSIRDKRQNYGQKKQYQERLAAAKDAKSYVKQELASGDFGRRLRQFKGKKADFAPFLLDNPKTPEGREAAWRQYVDAYDTSYRLKR